MTATSNLTEEDQPFTHLHQSTDDLIKKVKCSAYWVRRPAAVFSAVWFGYL